MLERTSGLLSELTSYAAVVVGPRPRVGGHPVGPAGRPGAAPGPAGGRPVRRRGREALDRAGRGRLRRAAGPGRAPRSRPTSRGGRWPGWGRPPATGDVGLGPGGHGRRRRRWPTWPSADEPDHVFVGGPSRLAGAFDAVETVRSVLAILEQQLVVVTLLRDVLDQRAVGGHRDRARLRAAGLVRRGGGPGLGGRAGRRRRRPARPDPDELPPGAGRRPRGGRAPGRADRWHPGGHGAARRRPGRGRRGGGATEADPHADRAAGGGRRAGR